VFLVMISPPPTSIFKTFGTRFPVNRIISVSSCAR
jgi:hypothetical protein